MRCCRRACRSACGVSERMMEGPTVLHYCARRADPEPLRFRRPEIDARLRRRNRAQRPARHHVPDLPERRLRRRRNGLPASRARRTRVVAAKGCTSSTCSPISRPTCARCTPAARPHAARSRSSGSSCAAGPRARKRRWTSAAHHLSHHLRATSSERTSRQRNSAVPADRRSSDWSMSLLESTIGPLDWHPGSKPTISGSLSNTLSTPTRNAYLAERIAAEQVEQVVRPRALHRASSGS